MTINRDLAVMFTIASLLGISSVASAQWAFVARKSMGAIHHLQSEHTDVATVLIEAPAEKVYSAAIRTLQGKQGARITRQDDATRTIDFVANSEQATMQVSPVEAKVSMLTIAAPGSLRRSTDVSPVVNGVLKVCRQMGVSCSLSKQ